MKCKNCGKQFTWADEMASMACRDKALVVFCRTCRAEFSKKALGELKKRKSGLFSRRGGVAPSGSKQPN